MRDSPVLPFATRRPIASIIPSPPPPAPVLQIYVTRADVVLSTIGLGFIGVELILAVLTILTFIRAPAVS